MERPTLRQLEILAEIARAGTFRGAARNLGLSQVAVSDHVKQLESRLGVVLFARNAGGRPSLLPAGQIVLDHGRNVLFACDALIAAARSEAGGSDQSETIVVPPIPPAQPAGLPSDAPTDQETPVTPLSTPEPEPDLSGLSPRPSFIPILPGLGMAKSNVQQWQGTPRVEDVAGTAPNPAGKAASARDAVVRTSGTSSIAPSADIIDDVNEKPITVASHPAILSRFQDRLAAAQEAFPDRPIAVDFARYTAETVNTAFVDGRADIALFYTVGEVPGLPSEYLWSEGWSLFARHDHPLAQRDAVSLRDCDDMPVILFAESNPIRALAQACLARAGLWPTPTVLETDDYAAIAAELDFGEAIFPAFGVTAQQFAARAGIKRLALVEPLPGVEVRRAVAPGVRDDPTIAAIAGVLGQT